MSIDTGVRAHRFMVGTMVCTIVSDGSLAYPDPAHLFFVNAPQAERDVVLRAAGIEPGRWHEYVSPHCALLVDTGDQRVLVDTGGGGFAPTNGKLHENLRAEGIGLDSVDVVVLTHAHADHSGGNLNAQGEPAFPNASYVIWRDEWDFWTHAPDLSSLPLPDQSKASLVALAKRNLPPIERQLKLIDTDTVVAPGVQALAAPGHTPGHAAVLVSSDGAQLLWTADAVLHPIQVNRPDWYATFDLRPEQAVATRRDLLARAADERMLVHAAHFSWPGLGRVTRQPDGFQWEPAHTNMWR